MADGALAVFALEPALEAAIGLGQVALASMDQLQRLRDDFEGIWKAGEPTFVEVLKVAEKIDYKKLIVTVFYAFKLQMLWR